MSDSQKPVLWGDAQQYWAEKQDGWDEEYGVLPKVTLLSMSPDPLGVLAAMCQMYEGKVVRDLSQVTDEQRLSALADVQKTHLKAPLEAIKVHYMIEGIDRGFAQQLTRQRTAVYSMESLRFAVVGDVRHSTSLPPSIHNTKEYAYGLQRPDQSEVLASNAEQRQREIWDYVLNVVDWGYNSLVNEGMPAEDARGLLPLATATRTNYVTDLRNLSDHAGNRLCTQAQFHWREVFNQFRDQIRNYLHQDCHASDVIDRAECETCNEMEDRHERLGLRSPQWQFDAIADSGLFRPVCYQLGHCPFKASFDRACTIRGRVDTLGQNGIPSERWGSPPAPFVDRRISDSEWEHNPAAARK